VDDVVPIRLVAPHEIKILDQTLLPAEERYETLREIGGVVEAIQSLRVRGAPLLGVMGAAGMALAASTAGPSESRLRAAANTIGSARPTAVDLAKACDEALALALGWAEGERVKALWRHAGNYLARRMLEDRAMGALGADVLGSAGAVLTHCNTGALATGGIGTALGVIRTAWELGRLHRCYATETRPLLQGARLTMWELARLGIPATLLPDTAAASLIASGRIQAVITGADRIAANGDTANKVGTYGLAAVAARHKVPFYIAAPTSTIDRGCADGSRIPIEFRGAEEVGGFAGNRWAPPEFEAYNPAFDVTPAALIAAIITERTVHRPPYAFDAASG
jgi:methylthioribose-1-phosphate isomerase